ncbi:MAG: hypothetical protein JWN96_2762 [Mycobacterium sp.]|nr:hypothetical protein [Mycobacterium sp.]
MLFETGHLSNVLGLVLDDERRVVIKVRPWADRLVGCAEVHAALFRSGYPCPRPLIGPQHVGEAAVSAEALVDDHVQLAPDHGSARLFADALLRLVDQAPQVSELPGLEPTPPWADWQGRDRAVLWPEPDDRDADLNALETNWIDHTASIARTCLVDLPTPSVVGHLDWYSANLGWRGRELTAVFDWDSVGAQPEFGIAGLAAAVWPGTGGPGEEATLEQSELFLHHYGESRGWSTEERQAAWAAGLWVRCFDAKKAQAVNDDPDVVITKSEARHRLRLAGLPDDV